MNKKFFAQCADGVTTILIDGDRIDIDDRLIMVYFGDRLMAIIDNGNILYCYLTEKKDG